MARVEAVGTAFDVTAYPGDAIVQVVTAHGIVALRPATVRTGAGALVERGERGTLDPAGLARVVAGVNVDRAFAWTRGRLSYQLQPLDEVARDLHRWYGLDIVVTDTALARLRITMTLDHATADDAVQRLVETLGVRYHRVGNTVRLGE